MNNSLPSILIFLMWSIPFILSASLAIAVASFGTVLRTIALGFVPVVFALSFPLVGGLLSKLGQSGIKKGRFPRKSLHPIYLKRRIYGTCWTTIYYFKPLYSVLLSIPMIKKALFRLYGYVGNTTFTIYPDTWIRDLPLLNIELGTYLSNRATIGSNICMTDGTIYVDGLRFSKSALIGHLAVLGPGAKIGESSEVGVGATIGIKTRLGMQVKVGINATVMHGAVVDDNSHIGNSSFIGMRAHIYPNIQIPAAAVIPAGASVTTQADVSQYFSSERKLLELHVADLSQKLEEFIK